MSVIDSVKQDLMDRIGPVDHLEVWPQWVLVGIYRQPEMTKGGIILTDKALDEDKYQGKVGLVLKTGPNCFVDDDNFKFHGLKADVGDWVGFKVSETWALDINTRDSDKRQGYCRLVRDTDIRLSLTDPSKVW